MAAQSSKMVETAAGGQGTTKAVSMFSSLISQSSNFVMANVKNLVVKKHNLPLTKIVDEIMEQKQGKANEEFRYLDPKILRGQESGQVNSHQLHQLYFLKAVGKSYNVGLHLRVGAPDKNSLCGCSGVCGWRGELYRASESSGWTLNILHVMLNLYYNVNFISDRIM